MILEQNWGCFKSHYNARHAVKMFSVLGIVLVIFDYFINSIYMFTNMTEDAQEDEKKALHLAEAFEEYYSVKFSVSQLLSIKYVVPVVGVVDSIIGTTAFMSLLCGAIKQNEKMLLPVLFFIPLHFLQKLAIFISFSHILSVELTSTVYIFSELVMVNELLVYIITWFITFKLRSIWRTKPNQDHDELSMSLIRVQST